MTLGKLAEAGERRSRTWARGKAPTPGLPTEPLGIHIAQSRHIAPKLGMMYFLETLGEQAATQRPPESLWSQGSSHLDQQPPTTLQDTPNTILIESMRP